MITPPNEFMNRNNRFNILSIEDLVGLPDTRGDGILPIDCIPNDSVREQRDVGTPVADAGEYTVRNGCALASLDPRTCENLPTLQGEEAPNLISTSSHRRRPPRRPPSPISDTSGHSTLQPDPPASSHRQHLPLI